MECAYFIRFDLYYFFLILLENTPLSVVLCNNQVIVIILSEAHLCYYQTIKYILQYIIREKLIISYNNKSVYLF